VACLPLADHASWGLPFGPCEGARLSFVGDPPRFVDVEILRVVEASENDAIADLANSANGGVPT
jgi:hypothetical protein